MRAAALGLTLLAAGLFPQESAAQIQLAQGEVVEGEVYHGVRDVILINGDFGGRHYGAGSTIWVGSGPRGDASLRRSLLAFDLDSLPAEMRQGKVQRARLKLHCVQVSGEPFVWQMYAVSAENAVWTQEKDDGSREGKAMENVSSWNYRLNFYQRWSGGEGLGEPGGGYAETPLHEASTGSVQAGSDVEVELPPEVVQGWLGGANGGVLMRMQDEDGESERFIRFGASENPKPRARPVLEIEFE